MNNKMDLELCRLCSKNDSTLINVFEDIEKNLSEKIYLCFGVQIKQNDPISTRICRSCYFFTNTAYEHRISSLENDGKLKKKYGISKIEQAADADIKVDVPNVSYPSDISQNDFLNSLKLTTTDEADKIIKTNNIVHQSVKKLKRKYPTINIPYCCYQIDIDPYVNVLSAPKKKPKKSEVWSISKKPADRKSDLIFTMIKNDLTNETTSDKVVSNKYELRKNRSSSSISCSSTFPVRSSVRVAMNSSKVLDKEISSSKFLESEGAALKSSKKKNEHFCLDVLENIVGVSISAYKENITQSESDSLESLNTSDQDELPFQCSECPKKFAFARGLTRHRGARHPNEKTVVVNLAHVHPKESSDAHNSGSKSPSNNDNSLLKSPGQVAVSPKSSGKIRDRPKLISNKDIVKTFEAHVEESQSDDQTVLKSLLTTDVNLTDSLSKLMKDADSLNKSFESSDLLIGGEEVSAYICQTCNKIFDSLDLLKYHKRYRHKLSLRCNMCPKKFSVVENLMKHSQTHEKSRQKKAAATAAITVTAAITATTHSITDVTATTGTTTNTAVTATTATTTAANIIQIDQEEINHTHKEGKDYENITNNEKNVVNNEEKTNNNDLSFAAKQRAAALPRLSVTLEPLEYSQSKKTENPTLMSLSTAGKIVARKKTNGALFCTNKSDFESPADPQDISSDSYSSSSSDDDDDCKITDVLTNIKNESKLFDAALMPQSASKLKIEKSFLEAALQPQFSATVKLGALPFTTQSSGEVILIDSDSDDIKDEPLFISEIKSNNFESLKTNSKLTVQLSPLESITTKNITSNNSDGKSLSVESSSNSACTSTYTTTSTTSTSGHNLIELSASSSKISSTSTTKTNSPIAISVAVPSTKEDNNTKSNGPIFVSPSNAKSTTNTRTNEAPSNTKATNEYNYINYLFNKCCYDETTSSNESHNWNLQYSKNLARKTILPIEIQKVMDQSVSIKYSIISPKVKPTISLSPWNYKNAIDLNSGVTNNNNNKTVKLKPVKLQAQQLQNTGVPIKPSIKVPIAPTQLKTTMIVGPNNQFQTKFVPTTLALTRGAISVSGNAKTGSNASQPPVMLQFIPNTQQPQQKFTSTVQLKHQQKCVQNQENTLNKVVPPGRSLLRAGTATTMSQPILYTYYQPVMHGENCVTIPTTVMNQSTTMVVAPQQQQTIKQPFLMPYQEFAKTVNTINKTFVLQQTFHTTPENMNNTQTRNIPIYIQPTPPTTSQSQQHPPQKIAPLENITVVQEQNSKVVADPTLENNLKSNESYRPTIRIKSLSELTEKPKTSESTKPEANSSYLSAFANYVCKRTIYKS